jgi:hypothetical protein
MKGVRQSPFLKHFAFKVLKYKAKNKVQKPSNYVYNFCLGRSTLCSLWFILQCWQYLDHTALEEFKFYNGNIIILFYLLTYSKPLKMNSVIVTYGRLLVSNILNKIYDIIYV